MSSYQNLTMPFKPVTLESLKVYAPGQTDRIKLVLDGPFAPFKEPSIKRWEQLWRSAWDKDLVSLDTTREVQRGPDAIEEEYIFGDDGPPGCKMNVMIKSEAVDSCWEFECENILIRSEYKKAEDFLLSSCGSVPAHRGSVIAGRLGIG